VSLAGFIASQRTDHGVPHAVTCRMLDISEQWFYKWRDRQPTVRLQRRAELDAKVKKVFDDSKGTYGSPRVHAELVDDGETVGANTVAESMRRQGLVARQPKRRKGGLTRQDKSKVPFPDLVRRNFTAPAPNVRWVGDITEIPTEEAKLYLASVIDLYSRRLLGYATGLHPDADLAAAAINMAVAARGGPATIAGVIFHTDRGSTYTAERFSELCERLDIVQSMGRVGSCFDNAAAESWFSTLEWEVQSRHTFTDPDHARQVIVPWITDFYNLRRRHSSNRMMSPIDYENTTTVSHEAA
jgi:putative transposase